MRLGKPPLEYVREVTEDSKIRIEGDNNGLSKNLEGTPDTLDSRWENTSSL